MIRAVFVLVGAGLLYLGCTERDDVARYKDDGADAGMASSSSGAPGDAGSAASQGGGNVASAGEGGEAAGGAGNLAGAGGAAEPGNAVPAMLVAGVVQPSGAGMLGNAQRGVATSFSGGAWAPVQVLQDGLNHPIACIAVALLADGSGLAASGGQLGFYGTVWDGDWAEPVREQSTVVPLLGRMSAFPGGAWVAHRPNSGGGPIQLDTYDAEASSWTVEEDTGMPSNLGWPAVAPTGDGQALVVHFEGSQFSWRRKLENAWSDTAAVPIATPNLNPMSFAEVDLIKRVGVEQVVGVFGTDLAQLEAATFENGAWSTPTPLATDAATHLHAARRAFLSALPDGRVALAYWADQYAVKVGFFDGQSWSDFKVVPGVKAEGYSPVAITRGFSGAELELLYTQQSTFELKHTRLTSEASWSWTEPQVVDADYDWATIAVAASP